MTSLNPILARWLDDRPTSPPNCAGCDRPNKCCDFQPFVPNFMLGAALAAGRPLPAPDWRFGLQPLGLIPSAKFRAGRDSSRPEFKCVFYDRGACGIWAFRPGECSVFDCRGESPGFAADVYAFETTLGQMALIELGFGPNRVRRQIDILNDPGEQLAHEPDQDIETIYRRAWAWAQHLSRADIAAWLEDV